MFQNVGYGNIITLSNTIELNVNKLISKKITKYERTNTLKVNGLVQQYNVIDIDEGYQSIKHLNIKDSTILGTTIFTIDNEINKCVVEGSITEYHCNTSND